MAGNNLTHASDITDHDLVPCSMPGQPGRAQLLVLSMSTLVEQLLGKQSQHQVLKEILIPNWEGNLGGGGGIPVPTKLYHGK